MILQAVLGTFIGMGIAMILSFVEVSLGEYLYPSGGMLMLPSGITAAILVAILMGIVGGLIGLIVGAFRLGTYQGAAVGLVVAVFRWRGLYEAIRNIARLVQSGHPGFSLLFPDLLVLSLFFDFVIVGALVSTCLRLSSQSTRLGF